MVEAARCRDVAVRPYQVTSVIFADAALAGREKLRRKILRPHFVESDWPQVTDATRSFDIDIPLQSAETSLMCISSRNENNAIAEQTNGNPPTSNYAGPQLWHF